MAGHACEGEEWRATLPGRLGPGMEHTVVVVRRHRLVVPARTLREAAIEFERLTGIAPTSVDGVDVIGRCCCCSAPVLYDRAIHGDAGALWCVDEAACMRLARELAGEEDEAILVTPAARAAKRRKKGGGE